MSHGLRLRHFTLTAAIGGACSLGCANDDKLDLGADVTRTGALLSDYSGAWDGYAEAYRFGDKSDRVRLRLSADGTGTIEFGETPAPKTPNPKNSFPPTDDETERSYLATLDEWGANENTTLAIGAGFAYALSSAEVADARVQISASTRQLSDAWCARQTPMLQQIVFPPTDTFTCVPSFFWHLDEQQRCVVAVATPEQAPPDGESRLVDCGQLTCLWRCDCTADGCTARESKPLSLDGRLENEGNSLLGTLLIGVTRIAVRLERTTR